MKPVTIFPNTESMYHELRELTHRHPDCRKYEDTRWRIIELLPQYFAPRLVESVYIILEYHNVDIWAEDDRWLTVADDGEHPNGYETYEDVTLALDELDKPQTFWEMLGYLYRLALFEMGILATDVVGNPQFELDIDPDIWCGLCTIDINDKHVCLWDPDHKGVWTGYAIVDLYPEGYARHFWHELRRLAYEKGYGLYCGYHGRNIAITGHPDGWPSVWPGTGEYMAKAVAWLKNQPQGLTEEEMIERRRIAMEEAKYEADFRAFEEREAEYVLRRGGYDDDMGL